MDNDKQIRTIIKEELMEEIEDYYLYMEAERREIEGDGKHISQEELMKEFGITQENLDSIEDVEIDACIKARYGNSNKIGS